MGEWTHPVRALQVAGWLVLAWAVWPLGMLRLIVAVVATAGIAWTILREFRLRVEGRWPGTDDDG